MTGLPPLGRRLQRFSGVTEPAPDAILDEFVSYVAERGLSLYPAQEEAILELLAGKHVILATPTGSGKSLVAEALHFQALAEGRLSWYTAPTKALVNEKFFDLCKALGPERVGLLTGDGSVNAGAPVICATAEVLANLALRNDAADVDYVVMDEFHYYADPERGVAWQVPLLTMPDCIFLLMSATLGDPRAIQQHLEAATHRAVRIIASGERPVPLRFSYLDALLQDAVVELTRAGETPVYLVNFTQRAAVEMASDLASLSVCSREDRQAIAESLSKERLHTPFGKEFSRLLRQGIGVHHAGLLPRYRRIVERLAQTGHLKVISGTDTLGVGVNIPIRSVLFTQLYKYDGQKTAILSARDFHQIGGRAGRRGFDDHGNVVALAPPWQVENQRIEARIAENPALKKKLVKKKPPPGAPGWSRDVFERLQRTLPEPLSPRFGVTHGMLVDLLQSQDDQTPGGGYRRLLELIERSHQPDNEKRFLRRQAAMLFRSLVQAGIVELAPLANGRGRRAVIRAGLQLDFSLHHTLSLFLIAAIDLLDPESETYALDLLSLVEAILEDPGAVLYKQVDRLKTELIAKLKAEGVEYAERMERLERVEHPKPLAELLYQAFEEFARAHPWLARDRIRPKSIAREMVERFMTFNEYVQEYGLARSEGVLLRHLSQVYKTALQNVPEERWNDEFEETLAFLHGVVRRTDASLLSEWEGMQQLPQEGPRIEREAPAAARLRAFRENPRTQDAELRCELHALLKALARRDFEGALELVRQSEAHPWSAADLERALGPYFEEHGSIDVSARSRLGEYTFIERRPDGTVHLRQRILDPEGAGDWVIEATADPSAVTEPEGPVLELIDIHS